MTKANDKINHPAHYTHEGIECIDCIKAVTAGYGGVDAVCVGNIVKYLYRAKYKGGYEDIQKAGWYMERLLGKTGAKIDKRLLQDEVLCQLPPSARLLYIAMVLESEGKQEFIFTGKSCEKYGFTRRTLIRAKKELVAAGLIEVKSGYKNRTPNKYRIIKFK